MLLFNHSHNLIWVSLPISLKILFLEGWWGRGGGVHEPNNTRRSCREKNNYGIKINFSNLWGFISEVASWREWICAVVLKAMKKTMPFPIDFKTLETKNDVYRSSWFITSMTSNFFVMLIDNILHGRINIIYIRNIPVIHIVCKIFLSQICITVVYYKLQVLLSYV